MTIFLGCSSKFAALQKISASGCQSQVRVAPDCTVKDVYLLMKVAETRSDVFFFTAGGAFCCWPHSWFISRSTMLNYD